MVNLQSLVPAARSVNTRSLATLCATGPKRCPAVTHKRTTSYAAAAGRRPCLVFALCTNCLFGVASAFCGQWATLLLCRFLGGVGIGGSVPTLFALALESFPLSRRGSCVTLVAMFWMLGRRLGLPP